MKWYEDPTYIKMCEKAPKEVVKFDYLDQRQFAACTYHKCLVEYNEGFHEWQCPDMEEKQREVLARDITEWSVSRAWNRLQKSDDWCEDKQWVKLPRQHQLQEMVESTKKEGRPRTLELVERFNGYCATHTVGKFTSMEQLWLAFVMKEKYNKIWNGEIWK